MNKYECFYKGNRITVEAKSSYEAQENAKGKFRVKNGWQIAVCLAEKEGEQVAFSFA